MAITPDDVTEEMRRAVYAADCERKGHEFVMDTALRSEPTPNPNHPLGHPRTIVSGPSDDQLPYIRCRRCPQVWLVIEDPGEDYGDAERRLYGALRADGPLARRIVRWRGRREERAREAREAAEPEPEPDSQAGA